MSNINNHIPGIIIAALILAAGGYYSDDKQSDHDKAKPKIIHFVPEYGSKLMPNHDGSIGKPGKIFCEKAVSYNAPEPEWVKRKDLAKKYKLSLTYLAQHKYNECVNVSREIVKSDPRFGEAYYGMAFCQLALRDLDGAEQSYKQAMKLEPDSHVALIGMGAVASARNNHSQAIDYYRRAANTCTGDPAPHWSLASEYYSTGDYGRAAEEYRTYISLSNNPKGMAIAEKMLDLIEKNTNSKK